MEQMGRKHSEFVCEICGNPADGIHFGSLSCSACSAFFRRSISEHKRYICLTKDCDIKSVKHGAVCRYCRFQKCILVGMRPGEVQPKRGCKRKGSLYEEAESGASGLSAECQTNAQQKDNMAQNWKDTECAESLKKILALEHDDDPHIASVSSLSDYSPIKTVKDVRRRIEFLRLKRQKGDHCLIRKLDFADVCQIFHQEKALFDECIMKEFAMGNRFSMMCQLSSDDQCQLLFCWLVLESAFCSLNCGGIQTNRAYLPGNGFVELNVDGLTEFYKAKFTLEAKSLARFALPIGRFFLESVCRSLQMSHFKRRENDAIFALLLSNTRSYLCTNDSKAVTRREQLKRQVFTELSLDESVSSSPPQMNSPSEGDQQPQFAHFAHQQEQKRHKWTGDKTKSVGTTARHKRAEEEAAEKQSDKRQTTTEQQQVKQPQQGRLDQFAHHKIAQRIGDAVLIQCSLIQLVTMLHEHYNALTISR